MLERHRLYKFCLRVLRELLVISQSVWKLCRLWKIFWKMLKLTSNTHDWMDIPQLPFTVVKPPIHYLFLRVSSQRYLGHTKPCAISSQHRLCTVFTIALSTVVRHCWPYLLLSYYLQLLQKRFICFKKLDLVLTRLSNVQSVYVHSPRAAPPLLHSSLHNIQEHLWTVKSV